MLADSLRKLTADTITMALYSQIIAQGGAVGVWENGAITVGTKADLWALKDRFGWEALEIAGPPLIADVVRGQRYAVRCPLPPVGR